MPVNRKNVVQCLQEFDFRNLFIEELGWDHPKLGDFTFEINDENYKLTNISDKRGVQVFICTPEEKVDYPDNTIRRRIEAKIRRIAHEHLIIFIDHEQSIQRWQWVFRKAGQPAQYREHKFDKGQGSEALLQKLDEIEINIEDEEGLGLLDVAQKLKVAFDKDKITKKFYDHFKTQQKIFRGFIENIPGEHDQNWYSAVMLNRMMFIYFIQKKNFLNGDANYLKNKLGEMKEKFGEDNYYTFYKLFLRRLFHEGLDGHTPRGQELDDLLGTIPYLNGGIFGHHELEEKYPDIDIKDEAFEKLFAFFDQYQWHLDDRPLMDDKEINPDVLGYIFEKFINQKDMGAYYTKEDITEYISKNTIIPFLFDQAKTQCKIAFEGDHTLWDMLKDNPDRYFYDAVKKGIPLGKLDLTQKRSVELRTIDIEKDTIAQIPENISIGLDTEKPDLLDRRKDWNTKTPEEFALPTEIWRETIARWHRYFEVRQKVENGEIQTINDFITYNLNIRQFAQDVVETWEGPELIRAFYKAITNITVLDPTVGSGAFLFAALNILEPLYEACLNRMAEFVEDLPPDAPKSKFSDFKEILVKIGTHPSRSYFIYKTIIINNLYGVDIMDEAVEICKLRLFLKLVAQVETADKIEPLPDIDFNIRAGNTLVGFATKDEVEKAVTKTFDFDNNLGKITDKAEDVQCLYDVFLEAQMEEDDSVADFKKELRDKLDELNNTLNHYLAGEYGIDPKNKTKYENWLKTHQPFHWFVEFYGILAKGGFDVIIGNPPYIEYSKVRKEYKILNYKTEKCGNLYAFCMERSNNLVSKFGFYSMIVPISISCSSRMKPAQNILKIRGAYISNYSWRPAKLFEGSKKANLSLSVFITNSSKEIFTTNYLRWYSNNRYGLFPTINYTKIQTQKYEQIYQKIGSKLDLSIYEKIVQFANIDKKLSSRKTENILYYRRTGGLYWKIFTDFQPIVYLNGNKTVSSKEANLFFENQGDLKITIAILWSDIYWWW
ncbi:Eco57I restriction-modification methylase domain-containing protein, partial [candidate division KSB1 bacterium]|nr:Eco57I restriction-modification methylase domain-containing protein [candidate division KSB1 bacterium]